MGVGAAAYAQVERLHSLERARSPDGEGDGPVAPAPGADSQAPIASEQSESAMARRGARVRRFALVCEHGVEEAFVSSRSAIGRPMVEAADVPLRHPRCTGRAAPATARAPSTRGGFPPPETAPTRH